MYITGGSCHKYHFCRDRSFVATEVRLSRQKFLLRQAYFCCDKHMFVATKHVFRCDKSMLVATKLLSRQTRVVQQIFVVTNRLSRQKYFVATNIILSLQTFCRSKHTFVATKIVFCRDIRFSHDKNYAYGSFRHWQM